MTLLLSTFFTVFLLAFQQQNTTNGNHKSAVLTAFLIALSQFLMFRSAVNALQSEWYLMGLGGSLGVTSSMYMHRRFIK